MKKIYLIKNLSPWMINELLAFSLFTQFRVILLREPAKVYHNDIEELKTRGVEVLIAPFQSFPSLKKSLFSVYFILKNISCFLEIKNFVFGIKSIYWFTKLRQDVIPSRSSVHAQFATQASIIALLYRHYLKDVEYSFTFHAYDIYFRNKFFIKLINKSKIAFTISKFSIQYVLNKYPIINSKKLEISRLGTFISKEHLGNKIKKNKALTIGFLGNFVPEKNIFLLLKAMKILSDTVDNLNMYIAGDGPLRDNVLDFIKNSVLKDKIHYLGFVYGNKKEEFFDRIDVSVLPSISEGLPVVLMEALSFSIPIIATDITALSEICKNNYNGFLIPPGDIEALKEAILKFYQMDDAEFQEYRRRAYKSSRDYDIIENSKNKLEKLGWIESRE